MCLWWQFSAQYHGSALLFSEMSSMNILVNKAPCKTQLEPPNQSFYEMKRGSPRQCPTLFSSYFYSCTWPDPAVLLPTLVMYSHSGF